MRVRVLSVVAAAFLALPLSIHAEENGAQAQPTTGKITAVNVADSAAADLYLRTAS